METGVLKLHQAATIKLRKIECSVFFLLDKLEFADWSEVQRRIGCREIAIFRQRMMIKPPLPKIINVGLSYTMLIVTIARTRK